MNKENINKLIDRLQHLPPGTEFYMGAWIMQIGDEGDFAFVSKAVREKIDLPEHWCGTTACLGGWAAILRIESEGYKWQLTAYNDLIHIDPVNGQEELIHETPGQYGRKWLGLGEDTAHALFVPVYSAHFNARPHQAVLVLEHLRDTGEVDWSKSDIEVQDSPQEL